MKKTFVTCMVLVALFAIAGSAGAITCTVDQRPAATLLVPWFQVTFNPDGSPQTTTTTNGTSLVPALDTLVTIGNASSAPTIAHVSVFNERSFLVLDFNVALTGFDIQAMSMAAVLSGNLPSTPITQHARFGGQRRVSAQLGGGGLPDRLTSAFVRPACRDRRQHPGDGALPGAGVPAGRALPAPDDRLSRCDARLARLLGYARQRCFGHDPRVHHDRHGQLLQPVEPV